MKIGLKSLCALAVCAATLPAAAIVPGIVPAAEAANSVQIVVGGHPITSYDISHRIQFLKLRHKHGNLRKMAKDELVEQKLKAIGIGRAGAAVSSAQVDASFARFAQGNHLTPAKLTSILARAGVGADHFKRYIRVQMSWHRVVSSSARKSDKTRDLVSQMLEKGDSKPSTTEYILQQVIFLVPKGRHSTLGTRKRQAEAMRDRFRDCDSTRDFAAKLRNVAVRDLGRIMQPKLPDDWKSAIEKTSQGHATPIHVTKRGVEFIGVCSAKKVSDDLAAETVFKADDKGGDADSAESKKILAKIRKHTSITYQ